MGLLAGSPSAAHRAGGGGGTAVYDTVPRPLDLGLAFLNQLARVQSVKRITLGDNTPLTEGVANALVASALWLSSLDIGCRDFRSPEECSETDTATAQAVQLLLRSVGPRLQELSVCPEDLPTLVLDPLVHCTALTKLCVNNTWDSDDHESDLAAESDMLRAISSLTSLNQLTLIGGAQPPSRLETRHVRAAALESCLSPLTALTSLHLGLCCLQHADLPVLDSPFYNVGLRVEDYAYELQSEGRNDDAANLILVAQAEWRAVAAAARRMPKLCSLHVPARAEAADLASLTTLTHLVVGGIVASEQQDMQQGSTAPMLVYELPPRLKQLSVYAPLSMHVAAALQRLPAADGAADTLVSWQAPPGARASSSSDRPSWALCFLDSDVPDGMSSQLTTEALAAVPQAARNLKGLFRRHSDSGTERGMHLEVRGPGQEILHPPLMAPTAAAVEAGAAVAGGGGNDTHCGSWLRELMEELRPDSLKLWGFYLAPLDMLGMARCMGGLKVLQLFGCSYYLSSLPLLGDLAALEQLSMRTEDWWELSRRYDDFDDTRLIEGTFLELLVPAARTDRWADEEEARDTTAAALHCCHAAVPLPRLARITVFCAEGRHEELVGDGLVAVRSELRQRRPQGPELTVELYEPENDLDVHDNDGQ
ncbi:hypothetical protein PLESTB_000262800 [Pleodorina starrii]|uniref:Uncharacterized protein n=1 Tax=Pleodorina starrii TaxID=330485 RepID=A0A9W6BDE5_9CHLO|nr:hypothetical protein PLESTM_001418200 [Pleodorina starrii]GLC49597.1 hypothetical protein PLESTB_000262800 [Pleodorina starrii]GLC65537.1 hypothetical protein PLESTF_000307500 [Pleodorina starrii]